MVNMEKKNNFPIIGIGASAGGLSAFEAFFTGLNLEEKHDTSIIIVQHLSPTHKSMLRDIIQNFTKLTVVEITDKVVVQANYVYIIPPNKSMIYKRGQLFLFPYKTIPGQDMPIDFFFKSLGADLKEKSICILFSGSGTDGTKGLCSIKEAGGITLAQSPETAEYTSMPQSAIDSGFVDYILPPSKIGSNLKTIVERKNIDSNSLPSSINVDEENLLNQLFILIRQQVGHDFSTYKRTTINRRLKLRMDLMKFADLKEYIEYLKNSPHEVKEIYSDLLIGVTSFFRDAEAFKKLQDEIVPLLLKEKKPGSSIRIWCAGCSTGEEAYSLAIVFHECITKLNLNHDIQIFATDIDSAAITFARAGAYPFGIQSSISKDRLNKYFNKDLNENTYKINKTIRDMLIFSEHSIIKDPPYSRMDLVSCRNVMIYLDSKMQKEIIPSFCYALTPKGCLFLGSSESVGDNDLYFNIIDRKNKIFQRKETSLETKFRLPFSHSLNSVSTPIPHESKLRHYNKQISLKDIIEKVILKESATVGALVDSKGDILYVHGRLGLFLEIGSGEVTVNNILTMSKDVIKNELTIAFHKAIKTMKASRVNDIKVKIDGFTKKINILVRPVKQLNSEGPPFFAVLINDLSQDFVKPTSQLLTNLPTSELLSRLENLSSELRIKEDYIVSIKETHESSREQLQSTNSELQSVNEELQSTNEELETSKEELQSINEELTTVNNELQIKVQELSKINNDMNNLLAGTNIATIFLDFSMCLTRYTPTATQIINLIPTDIGRPIAHIVSNLKDYNHLLSDVTSVLDTLIPTTIQVETIDNKWFNMKIQPYRTVDNVIEGTVLTFTDITIMKKMNSELIISELKYRKMFETTIQGVVIVNVMTGKITDVNQLFLQMVGFTKEQLVSQVIWKIEFFSELILSQDNLLKLYDCRYKKYSDKIMTSSNGKKINIELICNSIVSDSHKLVQLNFREISKELDENSL